MAVSLCLLGVLMAMYRALVYDGDTAPAQALRLVTYHKVSITQLLPASYTHRMQQVPGVKSVMVWQWFGGWYKDARDPRNFFARFAVQPTKLWLIHSEMQLPEEHRHAFEQQRTGCVVSKTLADKFGWKLGERITLVGDIFPMTLELTLVGIFEEPEHTELLFFNWGYLRDSLPASSPQLDMVAAFQLQAQAPDAVPRIRQAIDTLFERSPYPTTTVSERAFQLSFVAFLGNLQLFLIAMCGAVTGTMLLVSANTLSMSVRERMREVGIMKTLGFTPSAILGIVLGEATIMALMGGAFGCGLAGILCTAIRYAPASLQAPKGLRVTPMITALSLLIALLIGLVSALLPALSASRTPIAVALRHTD
jgi:putative ABC transport system permease protein